ARRARWHVRRYILDQTGSALLDAQRAAVDRFADRRDHLRDTTIAHGQDRRHGSGRADNPDEDPEQIGERAYRLRLFGLTQAGNFTNMRGAASKGRHRNEPAGEFCSELVRSDLPWRPRADRLRADLEPANGAAFLGAAGEAAADAAPALHRRSKRQPDRLVAHQA